MELELSHPYGVFLQKIPEDSGGGYHASIPQLGPLALCASGDTIAETLANLEVIWAHLGAEMEGHQRRLLEHVAGDSTPEELVPITDVTLHHVLYPRLDEALRWQQRDDWWRPQLESEAP